MHLEGKAVEKHPVSLCVLVSAVPLQRGAGIRTLAGSAGTTTSLAVGQRTASSLVIGSRETSRFPPVCGY